MILEVFSNTVDSVVLLFFPFSGEAGFVPFFQ